MIFTAFVKALGQLGDRRFRRVVFLGILLALALLFGIYALFLQLVWWLSPDTIDLPVIGRIGDVFQEDPGEGRGDGDHQEDR